MKIPADDHGFAEILPFGLLLQLLRPGCQGGDCAQELVFNRLQLFKLVQLLLSQSLKLELEDVRQLRGKFFGLVKCFAQEVLSH